MGIENQQGIELPFNMSEFQTENFLSQKTDFARYLLSRTNGVEDVDRDTPLGKYLRTMRFYGTFHTACIESKLPLHLQGIITLAMQESKGDPLSRNLQNGGGSDGGAGLLHTQPDTAKRIGLSLYSDKNGSFKKPIKVGSYIARTYKECDYGYLRNTKKFSHADAYKIHGEGLVQIKSDMKLDYSKLSALDDRFNDQKNIASTIIYFEKAWKSIEQWAKSFNKKLSSKQIELYVLNAFNKGGGWKNRDGTNKSEPRFLTGGSHMKNLNSNLAIYQRYNKIIEGGIKKGLSYDQIYESLKGNNVSIKSPINQSEKKAIIKNNKEVKKIENDIIKPVLDIKKKLNDKSMEIRNKCAIISDKYDMRILDFNSSVGLIISPQGDYKTRYSMNLNYKDGYRLLSSKNTTIKVIEGSSYDVSDVVGLIMNMMVKSFDYDPDSDQKDIAKGLFEYDGDVIEFNANNRPRDPNVATQIDLRDFIKVFPKEESIKKIVTLMNEMYQQKLSGKSS